MSAPQKTLTQRAKALFAKKIFWGNVRRRDRNAPEMNRVRFLRNISIFESLSKSQLQLVSRILHQRHYNENEFIFEVDQPGAALFLIQSGQVSVETPATELRTATQFALLEKNSFLGELALLDGSPRSASARAVSPTTVLALSREDMDRLVRTDPDIASQIFRALAKIIGSRLKATNDLLDKEFEVAA